MDLLSTFSGKRLEYFIPYIERGVERVVHFQSTENYVTHFGSISLTNNQSSLKIKNGANARLCEFEGEFSQPCSVTTDCLGWFEIMEQIDSNNDFYWYFGTKIVTTIG